MSFSSELNQRAFGCVVYDNTKIVESKIIYDGRRTIKSVKALLAKKYPGTKSIVQKANARYYMTHSLDPLREMAKEHIAAKA